jgi:hypothetical protein
MIEITFNGKEHSLPENWEEVPLAQMPRVLELVFATPESGKSYHELLRHLLGFSEKKWEKMINQFFNQKLTEEKREKNAEVLQELLHCISWMWRENMTKQPFESLDVDGKTYYLFEEKFKTMSFGEMTDAYINAHAFIQQLEEGEGRLNQLLAIVCRPKRFTFVGKKTNWNGDIREIYNAFVSESKADLFSEVAIEKRILVLVYFLGSLKEFLSYYDIFDNDSLGPAKEEEYPGQSYIKNQHLLAEKGIFGNMQQTKSTNLHEVFLFLEENKKDIEDQIKRQKAADDSNR